MQLYALDQHGAFISASHASKQCNYYCLECRGLVRLRSGVHRRKHYYHIASTTSCRLNGKSLIHLQTQCFIQNLLTEKECVLEAPFPNIQRIADAVWLSKKIIFEIQCSPIRREEVLQRNQDYQKEGYQVIWIFHERSFNRWKISGAELALRYSPYYYTNIDEEGRGCIYDQFDLIMKGIRHTSLGVLPIDLARPLKMADISLSHYINVPITIQKRFRTWPIAFAGDLVHICSVQNPEKNLLKMLERAYEEERRLFPQIETTRIKKIVDAVRIVFFQGYKIVFQALLEKASR